MARGQDSRNHPNRQVGRVNLLGLGDRGDISITWEGGDREAVPFKELRHANPDSSMYGKRVTKKHLKEVSDKHNSANMFSTDDVEVTRDM
jgi:hypothetical protein